MIIVSLQHKSYVTYNTNQYDESIGKSFSDGVYGVLIINLL